MNAPAELKPTTRKHHLQKLLAQFDQLTHELDNHYVVQEALKKTIDKKLVKLDELVIEIQELTNGKHFN